MQRAIDGRERVKLRVADYATLDRSGAFAPYVATELIDGLVYKTRPQYRPHGFVKDELAYRIRRALELAGSTLHVATEQAVEIAPYSEPQPDIIVTSEPRGPGAIPSRSISLLVKVSDTTLEFDTTEKAKIYARAGIPEYWIADVQAKAIHQMWSPLGDSYAERRSVPCGATIAAATVIGLMVATTDL